MESQIAKNTHKWNRLSEIIDEKVKVSESTAFNKKMMQLLRIKRNQWRRYRKGLQRIPQDKLQIIADEMGVTVNDILIQNPQDDGKEGHPKTKEADQA